MSGSIIQTASLKSSLSKTFSDIQLKGTNVRTELQKNCSGFETAGFYNLFML